MTKKNPNGRYNKEFINMIIKLIVLSILIILFIIIVFTKNNDSVSVVFPITNVDQMAEIQENVTVDFNQVDNKLYDFDVLDSEECSYSYEFKFEKKLNLDNIYLISEDGEDIPADIYYDYDDYITVCSNSTVKPAYIYLPTAHGEEYYINVKTEN